MMKRTQLLCIVAAMAAILAHGSDAGAWDEDGHAVVVYLAFSVLPDDLPAWIKTPEARARLVYLSSEPDRWRGQHSSVLNHINNPDHYIDEEKLNAFGMTLHKLPLFRRQFTDLLAARRIRDPKKQGRWDARKDSDYTNLSPGLLPYRIAEVYWKIASGWTELRTYEAHRDRVSLTMLNSAKENIIYHMGILSHYVGDGAQPLHLTIHHHGWTGPNPKGFTTKHDLHSWIDGGILLHHQISFDSLAGRSRSPRKISAKQPWADICGYLYESFQLVEPLYEMEKQGGLNKDEGKRFIENRLLEGGSMLAGLWTAARQASHLDDFRVQRLKEQYPKQPGRAKKSKASN